MAYILADARESRCPDSMRSQYMIDWLDGMEREFGFVYNSQAEERFCAEHNVGPFAEGNSALGWLIYYNQHYRRTDAILRAGWKPGTEEMLRESLTSGRKIELLGENMLGGDAKVLLTVREVNGTLYGFKPRVRKTGYRLIGTPIRFADTPDTSAPRDEGIRLIVNRAA